MRWLDGITNARNMNLGKPHGIVKDREACPAAVHGVTESDNTGWLQQQKCPCIFCCWEFLSWKAIDFVKCFCICWYDHVVILSFILLMLCITLIDFHMLNYPGLVTLHHIYGIFKVPLNLVSKYFIIYYYYYYF